MEGLRREGILFKSMKKIYLSQNYSCINTMITLIHKIHFQFSPVPRIYLIPVFGCQ